MFKVGDLVALRTSPETTMAIIGVVIGGTETRYHVFQVNRQATYYESQLQPRAPSVEASPLGTEELHAFLTSLHLLAPSAANLCSLRSGRIQFVPYQYRPVLKLIRADRPRLLIADEVGIGKTIEAGLILKELRARMDISSVLVICPKALITERKWFLEMKRFDEHFEALDGRMLRHCLREMRMEGEWPDRYSRAIVPFSLFDSNLLFGKGGKASRSTEGLLDLDPPPRFDLVIVDEAHHIRNSDTYLHQAVRFFCDNSQAAIFLTATPVQMGSKDLFTLLNVLRPDLVIDKASFEQMAEPNPFINAAIGHCRAAEEDWQIKARDSLTKTGQTNWGERILQNAPSFRDVRNHLAASSIDDPNRIRLIRSLEDLYTFSPMINRTRRRDIGEFVIRQPETLTIDFTPDQRSLHDNLLDLVSRILEQVHGTQNVQFLMTTLRRQTASCLYGLAPLLQDMLEGKLEGLEEMEESDGLTTIDPNFLAAVKLDIKALLEQAESLDPHDPKVLSLDKVLQDKSRMANNKALVFSTFRHTLAYIERRVSLTRVRYGLVHGGIRDEERSELHRRFALPRDDTEALDVLLSSEVGSEGLDFQFCDLLINYDLPWNPMRIEQRIGRIDRYGQESETVAIINMVTPGTVDADIYERCLMRIGVFHHAVGGSEEILGEITQEIRSIAENFSLTPEQRADRLQQLGDNKIRQVQEEMDLEEKQAELFGLTIPDQSWNDEIDKADNFWLSSRALQRCVTSYLSGFKDTSGDFILGDKPLKTLRLGHGIRSRLLEDFRRLPRTTGTVARQWEKWLKGTEPYLSVTFEQEAATADPKTVYLDFLHPLVKQAALHHTRTEAAQVNLTASSTSVPPGVHPFALYQWHKVGVRSDVTLVAITPDPNLDKDIMSLMEIAVGDTDRMPSITASTDKLDDRHHHMWRSARSGHIAENRDLVQQRQQSLTISHQARCKLLEEHIEKTSNEKIRRMKEGELSRANSDYQRRNEELKRLAGSADIHAKMILKGMIEITRS